MNFAFLHGGGQGSWVWQDTIAALRHSGDGMTLKTLALDVPGCGAKRGRDVSALPFDAIVDELLDDMKAAAMTDVVLVGHSQAGTVLPALVDKRPELFQRVIYVSCSMPLPGQTVLEMIGNGVHGSNPQEVGWPVDPATTDMRKRTEIMMCNDMDDQQTGAFMARLGNDQWPPSSYRETRWDFSGLDLVPASYVLCEQDNILPPNWQEVFARRFHAQRIVRMDAGHQVMNTQPRALAEVLWREVC